MGYDEQLSAANFRAERDLARQECERLRARLRDSVPREAYERKRAAWLRQIRECEAALRKRREHIKRLENAALERRTVREEDREAAEWVREHGGLENVRDAWDEVVNLCATIGCEPNDESEMLQALGDCTDIIIKRLMPEGMEWLLEVWPKWSNGEYCKFGDWWTADKYGDFEPRQLRFGDWWTADKYGDFEPRQLRRLVFYTPEQLREWEQDEGDNYGYEWDFLRPSDTTYRPDKAEPPTPKVLDADGVEIEIGDDLYSVEGMDRFHVSAIDRKGGRIATEGMFALDKWADPKMYTHRAPVLAADGKPLREGETVWDVLGNRRFKVLGFGSDAKLGEFTVKTAGIDGMSLEGYSKPSDLTHERPDSWERLEEDATVSPETYCVRRGIDMADVDGTHLVLDDVTEWMACDLVRRAKKLSGVSE